MAADDHVVSLIFYADPPHRFTARLGRGGWLEGHGFSQDEALYDLAKTIHIVRPDALTWAGVEGLTAISAWLAASAETPVLAE